MGMLLDREPTLECLVNGEWTWLHQEFNLHGIAGRWSFTDDLRLAYRLMHYNLAEYVIGLVRTQLAYSGDGLTTVDDWRVCLSDGEIWDGDPRAFNFGYSKSLHERRAREAEAERQRNAELARVNEYLRQRRVARQAKK